MTSWTQIEDEEKVAEILGRLDQAPSIEVYESPELYELAYPGYPGDAAFYLSHTKSGRILYLGVGTGRIFVPMAEQNPHAYGIEFSREMCRLLRSRSPNVTKRVYQGDAVDAPLAPASFDVVVAPYSFLQVVGRDRMLPLLLRVQDWLKPGGRFITDIFSPYSIPFARPGLETNVCHLDGEVRIAIYIRYDHLSQRMQELAAFEQDGEPPRVLDMRLDYFFPCEVTSALLAAGFATVDVTGDYCGAPFDAAKNRVLVFEAVKR